MTWGGYRNKIHNDTWLLKGLSTLLQHVWYRWRTSIRVPCRTRTQGLSSPFFHDTLCFVSEQAQRPKGEGPPQQHCWRHVIQPHWAPHTPVFSHARWFTSLSAQRDSGSHSDFRLQSEAFLWKGSLCLALPPAVGCRHSNKHSSSGQHHFAPWPVGPSQQDL